MFSCKNMTLAINNYNAHCWTQIRKGITDSAVLILQLSCFKMSSLEPVA